MKIEYLHASKYGNGAMVAEEFDKQLAVKGVTVNVHHIREARPDRLVTGLKGPLEEGWQRKVEAFAARTPIEGQGANNGSASARAVPPTR